MLADVQALGNAGCEHQRVKLCLVFKFNGAENGEGQRQFFLKRGIYTDPLQSAQLLFQLFILRGCIDIGWLYLKVTWILIGKLTKPCQCRFVCFPVYAGSVRTKFADQPFINQSMLGSQLCGCVSGNTATYGVGLYEQIVDPSLVQGIRAQKSRQSAADNQHISPGIMVKTGKYRNFCCIGPHGIYHLHHRFLVCATAAKL